MTLGALLLLPMNSDEPFGIRTVVATDSWFSLNWPRLQSEIRADALIVAECRKAAETCSPSALQFVAIVDDAHLQDGLARIGHLNRAINLAIVAARRGGPLVWSSPLAVVAEGRSDCNGFAIVKYAVLDDVGAPEHRLIIVHVDSTNEDHMVVGVRSGARWLILDNRTMALVDSGASAYAPVLEFEQDGVRQFVTPNPSVASLPCSDAIAVAKEEH